MSAGHVEVALALPVFRVFTYRIDGPLPAPGTRVLVPFQRSERVGWVLGEGDPTGIRGIRPVSDVLEGVPSLPSELLGLARWMAEYYVAPLGVACRSMLPSVLSDGAREMVRLRGEPEAWEGLSPRATTLLEELGERGGEARVSALRKAMGKGSLWPEIQFLTERGLLEHETVPPPDPPIRTRKVVRLVEWIADLAEREERFGRAARQRECYEVLEASGGSRDLAELQEADGFSRSVIQGLESKGLVVVEDRELSRDPFLEAAEEPERHEPTPAQAEAIGALLEAAGQPESAPFLLHGVTGSGKTLVYIELLREIVDRRGRSAIVLVPEISLTPQTVSRFRAWFGDRVAVLHSALSQGERYDQWRSILRGEKRVVVGARSALFAPVSELGAIIVDEEHDGSYKQSEAPRYQARDVAVVRAHRAGALCVLGSATPSLESWRNARSGKFTLLSLPERVRGRAMPPVEVVDLRKHRDVLSVPLVSAVRERLERGEQAILLLNRRGYSSFIQCRGCGEVQECPNCSVSLTYHRGRARLLCHHCRHEEGAPDRCPGCGDPDLSFRGLGTEQVERVVAETFPEARIARMDVDTTSGKWAHHEILGRVKRGEVDILLGTQMISKGLDFPGVTFVGVVNADVGLHLPDFRASERSFQLLSQVAGRTGRGARGGRVVIQSSLPEHYVIRSALSHDFLGFAQRELEARKSPPYPPHLRLANVVISSPDPALVADGAEGAAKWIRRELVRGGCPGMELVGPAPSPIERLHNRWRWHFFLRGGRVRPATRLFRRFLEEFRPPSGDLRVILDRDPVALL